VEGFEVDVLGLHWPSQDNSRWSESFDLVKAAICRAARSRPKFPGVGVILEAGRIVAVPTFGADRGPEGVGQRLVLAGLYELGRGSGDTNQDPLPSDGVL